MKKSINMMLVLLMLLIQTAYGSPTGREIMEQVDGVDTSRDTVMKTMMIIERGDLKLVRKMEQMTKQYGEGLKDERSLIRFIEPADVHKTAYLTWSYDNPDQEDDMWIFLPAESLIRRISGGGKKGSFMRSDLANEDIEDRSIDDDEHTLIGSQEVSGADCWIIESKPRPELEKDTNYSKRVLCIRKDILLPLKVEYFDKRGRLLKTATHGGYEKINGIWTITKSIYETPSRKTRTLFQRFDIAYNQGIDDTFFLQSKLKR